MIYELTVLESFRYLAFNSSDQAIEVGTLPKRAGISLRR